jgi:hypothetical protein
MDPLLFIIQSDRPDLHEYLASAFRRDEHIQVILDERLGERRQAVEPPARERRRPRQRRRHAVDTELERLGLAVVRERRAAA